LRAPHQFLGSLQCARRLGFRVIFADQPWVSPESQEYADEDDYRVGENPLFRKNTTGAARFREQPLARWPMVLPSLNGSASQKNQQITWLQKFGL
jgi:hypothetical protein